MKYEVVVLPMDKEEKINRQINEFADLESAKQNFHFNCGKYFKNETLKKASVCILDENCNRIDFDYWEAPIEPTPEPTTTPEVVTE